MKFENLMLHSLFVATSVVCGLILGAMLHAGPRLNPQSNSRQLSAVLGSAPRICSLVVDGVVCPRTASAENSPTQA